VGNRAAVAKTLADEEQAALPQRRALFLVGLRQAADKALRVVPLPRVTVQRHVGLLERRQHSRQRFTQAVKDHFGARSARAPQGVSLATTAR
jgi:hypothetical protein